MSVLFVPLIAIALSQAPVAGTPPSLGVVVIKNSGVPEKSASRFAEMTAAALADKGIAVSRLSPVGCDNLECVAKREKANNLWAVIGLDLGALGDLVAIHVDALKVEDASRLTQQDIGATVEASGGPRLKEFDEVALRLKDGARAFQAARVEAAAKAAQAAKANTWPKEKNKAAVPPEALAAPVGSGHSGGVLAWGSTSVAVAAAAASVVFGALALRDHGKLDPVTIDNRNVVLRPQAEAAEIQSSVNGRYTAAGIAAGTSILFGALATWLFLPPAQPEPEPKP